MDESRYTFKFGDILENGWAGEKNPLRIGIFLRETKPGYEMTDGKGEFWTQGKINHGLTKIGEVAIPTQGEENAFARVGMVDETLKMLEEMQRTLVTGELRRASLAHAIAIIKADVAKGAELTHLRNENAILTEEVTQQRQQRIKDDALILEMSTIIKAARDVVPILEHMHEYGDLSDNERIKAEALFDALWEAASGQT